MTLETDLIIANLDLFINHSSYWLTLDYLL